MWTGNRFFVCMLIWCRISLRIQWANFYSDRTTFSPSNRHFTKNSQNDEICSLFNPSLRKTLAIPNMKSMFPIQVGSKQLHYRSNFQSVTTRGAGALIWKKAPKSDEKVRFSLRNRSSWKFFLKLSTYLVQNFIAHLMIQKSSSSNFIFIP